MPDTLIDVQQLRAHLDAPDWAIIDCRFELPRPEWGAAAYAAGHIPGALYAHLEHDLSGPRRAGTGRHPLPEVARFAATCSRFGIDAQVQVIAYDQGSGAYAARLWWLLRWVGHRRVAVLDGGLAAWQRAGLPLSEAPATRAARQFVPQPQPQHLSTTADIEAALESGALTRGETLLIDARSAERFAGQNETIDPVAGHVPGARNHPFTANHDAAGHFLPPAELRRRLQHTLGDVAATQAIVMCGSGVTACHNLLALEAAGLPGARLYAGSWSEWITAPARPVARGP
ncbi:MAG: sulfurtransferase [Gammaproteobacteria bacterium]|nr:sulfurtransferase [Gammaproteobacteria bacterium]